MAQDRHATTLAWGVKQSFRSYVEAVGGAIETAAGAERAADGAFVFAPAPESTLALDAAGALKGAGAFLGEVSFKAHGGMLDVVMADPGLAIDKAGAALTVADSARRTRRIEVARLDLSAMTTTEDGALVIPAAVTLDGYMLLGDHYPPRTPLDPVVLTLAP